MTNFASCCASSAFHIWPDVRIAAGIEASMMMSLGTCRFVIPRDESTMARLGPVEYASVIAFSIDSRLSAGSFSSAVRIEARPSSGSAPTEARSSAWTVNTSAK